MIGDTVAAGVARILDVSAQQVFSDPVHVGDRVVIPAATIERYGGFGYGGDVHDNGGGGGGGAGGGRPVAVIEAGVDGVRVRPVLDFTKIGLTLVAAGLTVWKAARAANGGRPPRSCCGRGWFRAASRSALSCAVPLSSSPRSCACWLVRSTLMAGGMTCREH